MNELLAFFKTRNGLLTAATLLIIVVAYLGIRETRHWNRESDIDVVDQWPQVGSMEADLKSDSAVELVQDTDRRLSSIRPFGYSVMQNRKRVNDALDQEPESRNKFEEQPPLVKFRRTGATLIEERDPNAPGKLKLPYGTRILGYAIEPLFSDDLSSYFDGRVTKSLKLDGRVIVPIDTRIVGRVRRVGEGRIYFNNEFELIFPDGSRYGVTADLQERAYDPKQDRYFVTNGRLGLPAKEVDAEIDPIIGQIAREVGKTAKSIVTRQADYEIRQQLPSVSLRGPLSALSEVGTEQASGKDDAVHYFISTGTEFYLFIR